MMCPIRQVISKFGDKWSMLVLMALHNGGEGSMRFSDLRRYMTDCSSKMLTATLKNLEANHLIARTVYPEVPPRVEYSLTETGHTLIPALQVLINWAKEHFDDIVANQVTE